MRKNVIIAIATTREHFFFLLCPFTIHINGEDSAKNHRSLSTDMTAALASHLATSGRLKINTLYHPKLRQSITRQASTLRAVQMKQPLALILGIGILSTNNNSILGNGVFGLSSTPTTTIGPRKALGKRSFVPRAQKEDIQQKISSPEYLLELVQDAKLRKRGSNKYVRSWRHWSTLTIETIRYHLSENLPHPVHRQEFEALCFSLGVAADVGEMPSFSNAGSRSGYAVDFFCRSRLLSDILMDVDNPTLPPHWKGTFLEKRLLFGEASASTTTTTSCNITSLGGGPGFDFVAAALVATYNTAGNGNAKVHATIMDYEEGWQDLVVAMNVATQTTLQQPNFICSWGGKCDITQPLTHPNNAATLKAIPTTDLWTCQYCVSENLRLLRETDYVFFRDLFEAAPVGALFLFTETTTRVWPDFLDMVQADFPYMEIGFPKRTSGRSKKSPQMVLCKQSPRDACPVHPRDLELADEFRRYLQRHERKMDSGWERQVRKIRGSKNQE